jgi:ribosome maturation factor RimP
MKNIIKHFAKEIAEEDGVLLINSVTKGSNKNPQFEIFIDSEEGISADDCAGFSRELKNRLESTEIGGLDYKLVVSSPGIDEPLKYLVQYKKHVDREFKLSIKEDDKVISIEAKLIRIEDDDLIFLYKNNEMVINFNNIKKAKVKISF